ncbi:MAG: FG-GAP-like repeat-containing protein, partial [Bacteroidota bacterium]
GKRQKAFLLSARGYLSQSENVVHFGLGNAATADSVVVIWASGAGRTVLKNVAANQTLQVNFSSENNASPVASSLIPHPSSLFASVAAQHGLAFHSQENDFIDFNFQRTLPHKVSQPGPAIAVGDANGDGLDDIFLTGSSRNDQTWFLQQAGGRFVQKTVRYKTEIVQKEEDVAALLFDADGDGDNDLYLVRGSGQSPEGDSLYQDVLCLNDGKGNFKIALEALPVKHSNGSCVKAADFDGDGDLDLFVGSRVLPKAYPMPDRSFLLRNDSTPLRGGAGGVKFTDVTEALCPDLLKPGMVTDALWTDFNADNQPDLLLACEWQPLRFFQNEKGARLIPHPSSLIPQKGWWNSLAAADLDNDGDTDYIAGNFGENLYFRCTSEEPLRIYAKDFDGNQAVDPFISCYWKDSLGDKHEFFYHPREDVIKQMPSFRKKFNTFGEYGEATVQEIFTKEELTGATILEANWMKTSVLENLGGGKFRLQALPAEAQLAPVYGILPHDVNSDGWLDLLLVGNDYGMELQQGRADAFAGLVILNKGKWQFDPVGLEQSHFVVPGDARALASVVAGQGEELIIATQSADSLRVFAPMQAGGRHFFPVKK